MNIDSQTQNADFNIMSLTRLGDVFVVDVDDLLRALELVLLVGRDLHGLALDQVDLWR
jgi:hypothetical protein